MWLVSLLLGLFDRYTDFSTKTGASGVVRGRTLSVGQTSNFHTAAANLGLKTNLWYDSADQSSMGEKFINNFTKVHFPRYFLYVSLQATFRFCSFAFCLFSACHFFDLLMVCTLCIKAGWTGFHN
jgi:hypothetical protein